MTIGGDVIWDLNFEVVGRYSNIDQLSAGIHSHKAGTNLSHELALCLFLNQPLLIMGSSDEPQSTTVNVVIGVMLKNAKNIY